MINEVALAGAASIPLTTNRLSVLPPAIGELLASPNMQHVSFQNNRLVVLPEMPASSPPVQASASGFVPGLLTLDASNNRIVQLLSQPIHNRIAFCSQ